MHEAVLIFVVLPVVYSVAFLGWCYLAEKKPIFSKRNSRSALSVICRHTTVLLILVILAQMAFRFYSSLPSWLTDKAMIVVRGGRYSYFELFCIASVWAIGAAETRWIYVGSDGDRSDSGERPS